MMIISRSPSRLIKTFIIIFLVLLAYFRWHQYKQHRHHLAVLDADSISSNTNSDIVPGSPPIQALCRPHGFSAYPGPRKVYDLFLLSTELDWLEIRLHTLSPYVDYFVIVESPTTFTGLPKPLHLSENWSRFAQFHSKIIHRVVTDPITSRRTWDHEDFFRNALFTSVFPTTAPEQTPALDDVLIVSDIDEIPKPRALSVLRYCTFPARLTLRSKFYYYSFQWRHRGAEWAHPQATVYRGPDATISPQDLRNGEGGAGFLGAGWLRTWWEKGELGDAAWHCSSCFSTVDEMRRKMESFSHTGWNTEANRDREVMMGRVRDGRDLFGRTGEVYDRVEDNADVPGYILENRERFGYMLDRDGENAGFVDG